MLREIFEETINEESFTPQESPQKSEEDRLSKDNGENITSTLECKHLSVVEHLTNQFADNFSLHVSKEKEVVKSITMEKDELFTNGVVLIVLSDEFKTKMDQLVMKETNTRCQS